MLSDGVSTMVPGVSERTGGASKFQHLDRLGTAARKTDASGTTVATRTYDAFGVPTANTDPASAQGYAAGYGYQEDAESGLKLLGHRYYDPGAGRFLTRDPVGSGTNWYRYADNNPLKNVDPTGLTAKTIQDYDTEHNTDYTGKFKSRIKSLKDNGEVKAAGKLQYMLDHGKIMVDDDPKRWFTADSNGKPVSTAAETAPDGSEITFSPGSFGVSEYLEGYMLHEVTHVFNDEAHLPPNEQSATKVTAAYARRMAAKIRRTTRDGSEAEWDALARTQDSYGAMRASRDRGRFLDLFKKIFGGYVLP